MNEQQLIQALSETVEYATGFRKAYRKNLPPPIAVALNNPGEIGFWRGRDKQELPVHWSGQVIFPDAVMGRYALKANLRIKVLRHRMSARDLLYRWGRSTATAACRRISVHLGFVPSIDEPLADLIGLKPESYLVHCMGQR